LLAVGVALAVVGTAAGALVGVAAARFAVSYASFAREVAWRAWSSE
jgi:hypothetical protein